MNGRFARLLTTAIIGAGLLSAEIHLRDVRLPAGGSLVIPLSLQRAAAISGVQFDLEYDRTALKVEVTIGEALRSSAKQTYLSDVERRQRVVIVGSNSNPIGEGVLLYLHVSASRSATGVYAIRIVNLISVSFSGDEVNLPWRDAAVQIDPHPEELVPDISVMNAASFITGSIAPGEIITAIGAGFLAGDNRNFSEVICLINGGVAPLLHLDVNRFSAIVPASLAPDSAVVLELRHGARILASSTLSVTRSAPGIFTQLSTGVGQAIATNQDGSINSADNPAVRSSILRLFVTGTGTNNPVSVRTGTTNWEVLQAVSGADIPGVTTVVARVPSELEPGTTIGIVVEAGGNRSQDGVTVAVR